MKITSVKAEKILATNGKPTLSVTINKKYTASVPQGTSTGKQEVAPFPKKGGLASSIDFLNNCKEFELLEFEDFTDLRVFENYSEHIGGSGVLALQYATLRALAAEKPVWNFLNPRAKNLPIPLGNVIGGGAHAKGNAPDFQEFLLIPRGPTFADNILANELIWRAVKKQYPKAKLTYEESFVVPLPAKDILDFLKDLTIRMQPELGFKVDLGLDIAASHFCKNNTYTYKHYSDKEQAKALPREGHIGYINHLIEEYGLSYVEDPLVETDPTDFADIKNTLVCGDDLICTNLDLLKKYEKNIQAIIIKPNQIGSVTSAKKIVDYCQKNNITPVLSHRSGETMDDMIAHLAVAWNVPYIKLGIHGKEHLAKIKTLESIEKELGKQ